MNTVTIPVEVAQNLLDLFDEYEDRVGLRRTRRVYVEAADALIAAITIAYYSMPIEKINDLRANNL